MRINTKKLILVGVSTFLAIAAFIVAYESIANYRYYRWKESFSKDNYTELITVKSPNPVLVWEYNPNGRSFDIETNRYGFRDRDYESPAKPEGVYRIAFIGDSVTMGWKVDCHCVFTKLFEEMANRRVGEKTIQAMNIAVDGYDVRQVAELLRTKALMFSPDKVVYVVCLNDFDFEDSSSLKHLFFHKPGSFLIEKLRKIPRNVSQLFGKDATMCYYDKNRDVFFSELRSMNDTCRKNGVVFEVVIVPAFYGKANFSDYPLPNIHAGIEAFCGKEHIACVDLLREYVKREVRSCEIANDAWHLNKKGHSVTAAILLEALAPE